MGLPDDLRAAAAEALARKDFGAFCARMDPAYQAARHTKPMVEHLQALAMGEIEKLMIFMPPRHGKTYHASERFPAFFEGVRKGAVDMILASYSIDRARASSRKVRGLFREPTWPFKDISIAHDSQAVDEWRTDKGGIVKAAGVGGGITGFGAHLLAIDDPFKDRQEAESIVTRDGVWMWYTDVAKTRLMPNSSELLMHTRWHDDDLAGRILNTTAGKRWTVLLLSEYPEDGAIDLLDRQPGEPLWPTDLGGPPVPSVADGEISSRSFQAMYQQNPQPADGSVFRREWFAERYTTLPELKKTSAGVDGAWKIGVSNDRSACVLWGFDGVLFYVLDAWADRLEYPDLRRKLTDYCARMNPSALAIEDAASGVGLIQELKRTIATPVIVMKAKGDKVSRAEVVTPIWESGKVRLPESAPWVDEFINEHLRFPNGQHDDFVDAGVHGLTYLSVRSDSSPMWGSLSRR